MPKLQLSIDIVIDIVNGVDGVSRNQTLACVEIGIWKECVPHVIQTLFCEVHVFIALNENLLHIDIALGVLFIWHVKVAEMIIDLFERRTEQYEEKNQ